MIKKWSLGLFLMHALRRMTFSLGTEATARIPDIF